jgi:hypothetical protein
MATATFTSADQNWQAEQTTYWFELEGEAYGADVTFGEEPHGPIYGAVVSNGSVECYVEEEGYPLAEGTRITLALSKIIELTDKIKSEAASS